MLIPHAVNVSGGTAWFCFTSALNAIVVQGGGGIPLVVGATQLMSDISGWVGNLIYVPPPAVPSPPTAAPVSVGSAEQPR